MNGYGLQFRAVYISIFTVFALVMGLSGMHSSILADNVYAKYSNSQSQSQIIDCQSGGSGGGSPICANSGPLIQADGTANTPINSQISNGGREGVPGPAGPPGPPGPEGPPGTSGAEKELQVRSVDGTPLSIPSGQQGVRSVACGPGEVATGGSYTISPFLNEINPDIIADEGLGSNVWFVTVNNPGPNAIEIIPHVQCAKLVDVP
jgi:hypothetical protein